MYKRWVRTPSYGLGLVAFKFELNDLEKNILNYE